MRPSVLLVTIDTLRADAAGAGLGTPAIEGFLAGATQFRNARTTVPLTVPAHASLLTGLDPRHNGSHDNVLSSVPASRSYPMLAEEFARAGYATAGFPGSGVLGPHTGLAAGFQTYSAPGVGTGASSARRAVERPAEARVDLALRWLKDRPRDKPYFLWVHFFDPHGPYVPYAGDARRAPTKAEDDDRTRYAGEVRRVDAAIERLLAAVDPGTIVVLCSDHGEALGEHGEKTHGVLCHSATADIFLAAKGPGLTAGACDDTPRSICDVAPTLRAWCGLQPQPTDGVALTEAPKRALVTESLYFWRSHGWGQCFSVADGSATLVESGAGLEMFDRARDRRELHPLDLRTHPGFEPLDRSLQAYRSGPTAATSLEAGPETPYGAMRRPETSYLTRKENARLPDSRTRFAYVDRLDAARVEAMRAWNRRDMATLRKWSERIQALADEDAFTAVPFQDLLFTYRVLGEGTGDRTFHRRAAGAAREILNRGYFMPGIVDALCSESLLAGDSADLKAALEALDRADDRALRESADAVTRLVTELRCRGDSVIADRVRQVLVSAGRS